MKNKTLLIIFIFCFLFISCNSKEIPSIRRHDHSVKTITEIAGNYGLTDPEEYFLDADSFTVYFTIDSRDCSLAKRISDENIVVSFSCHNEAGKVLAEGKRLFDLSSEKYGEIYSLYCYEYDSEGRRIIEREFQEYKNSMKICREFLRVYSDDGLSMKEHTIIYSYDEKRNITKKQDYVDDAADEYFYYKNGNLKDKEVGDLRVTCDEKGNYLTYWHFEGGEWIFKNYYGKNGLLKKQVAKSLEGKDKRIWIYEYDKNKNLISRKFPDWLWTYGGETFYFYDSDNKLIYTKTFGGHGMLGDPPLDCTPEEYQVEILYNLGERIKSFDEVKSILQKI